MLEKRSWGTVKKTRKLPADYRMYRESYGVQKKDRPGEKEVLPSYTYRFIEGYNKR